MIISGYDHVAITVEDLQATCDFYDRLFGITLISEYAPEGRPLQRQIRIGEASLSVHQSGNGLRPVARRPTPGAADICFRLPGRIEDAVELLSRKGVAVVEGPAPRRTAGGQTAQSVYFEDPDGNLIELMCAD